MHNFCKYVFFRMVSHLLISNIERVIEAGNSKYAEKKTGL